jgi:hypothetical protein
MFSISILERNDFNGTAFARIKINDETFYIAGYLMGVNELTFKATTPRYYDEKNAIEEYNELNRNKTNA